jgi:hypothetical protein
MWLLYDFLDPFGSIKYRHSVELASACLVLTALASIRVLRKIPKKRWAPLIVVSAWIFFYGARAINVAFDHSLPEHFLTQVIRKTDHHSYRGLTYATFDVFPLPGLQAPQKIWTPLGFYSQAAQGELISLTLHPGALGDTWVESAQATGVKGTLPADSLKGALHAMDDNDQRTQVLFIILIAALIAGGPIALAIEYVQDLKTSPPQT